MRLVPALILAAFAGLLGTPLHADPAATEPAPAPAAETTPAPVPAPADTPAGTTDELAICRKAVAVLRNERDAWLQQRKAFTRELGECNVRAGALANERQEIEDLYRADAAALDKHLETVLTHFQHQQERLLGDIEDRDATIAGLTTRVTELEAALAEAGTTEQPPAPPPEPVPLPRQLGAIRITEIDVRNALLEDVIDYLKKTAQAVDPEGPGVQFVLVAEGIEPGTPAPETTRQPTIDLQLRNTTLMHVLEVIAKPAGLSYTFEDNIVHVHWTPRPGDASAAIAPPLDPFDFSDE